MSERFQITKQQDVPAGRVGVIDTTIPKGYDRIIATCDREVSAVLFVEQLNELQHQIDEKPLDLHFDFEEWNSMLDMLVTDEKRLIELKQFRDKEEMRIINEVDFKELYGKNNETIRKNHVKEELSSTFDEINSLKLSIEDNKRRISFLKSMIEMKIQLLKFGVDK